MHTNFMDALNRRADNSLPKLVTSVAVVHANNSPRRVSQNLSQMIPRSYEANELWCVRRPGCASCAGRLNSTSTPCLFLFSASSFIERKNVAAPTQRKPNLSSWSWSHKV
jgi:hypothetical protein